MAKKKENPNRRMIAENRKAYHDYFVVDEYEAGLALTGTEVKSLRAGRANLRDAYARIKNGEVWIFQMHISPYTFAYYGNHEPLRVRKALLHKSEIKKLYSKANEKGHTLVPLKLYFNQDGRVKLLLALAKGKQAYDKRDTIRQRDAKRDLDRARKEFAR